MLPSAPYPSSGPGYWGPDYYATIYSAEIVNTITNLMFVILAWKGMSSCIKYGHDRVFLVAFLSYLVIGVGSMLFHSTLIYPMQLVDELAMIYLECILAYSVFAHQKSPLSRFVLALSISALAIFITLYYHYLQDPVFHQNMFALLTATVVFRSMWIMEHIVNPKRRVKDEHVTTVEQKRRDERDSKILSQMWKLNYIGLTYVALAFFIWNLDNIYCGTIRRWRREVGLPWGIFLEAMDGGEHILTGIAAYNNITWSIWLRYCRNGKQDLVELEWPSMFTSMPVVVGAKLQNKVL
ncbi:alkaline phytoceramidase [Botrytis cinerea]